MRKVWIYKRKGIKGWWVGWYESGIRRAKALLTEALAEHYRQIKHTQLNSAVFTGTVTIAWQQMVDEYTYDKQVAGVVEDSLYEVASFCVTSNDWLEGVTRNRLHRTLLTGSCSREARKQNARHLIRT
jgi:hypothetical protein